MADLVKQFEHVREAATPLVLISSTDQPALETLLFRSYSATGSSAGPQPWIHWDMAAGATALNPEGQAAIAKIAGTNTGGLKRADEFLAACHKLPEMSVVVAHNLPRLLDNPLVCQGVANLREPFKRNGRTLVMTDPDAKLPLQIRHDVVVLEDPLPTDQHYEKILGSICAAADIDTPKNPAPYVSAVRSLSAFAAEQIISTSVRRSEGKLDLEALWDYKRTAISQVQGLSLLTGGPTLSQVHGVDEIVRVFKRYCEGPSSPWVFVLIDEIEKALAGLGTKGGPSDNTGATQNTLLELLTNMEKERWNGALLFGLQGAGKTFFAQAIGATYDIPLLNLNLGALKDSKLGASEAFTRDAMRTIKAMGRNRVCFLATCNRLEVLPAELLRRFRLQKWYFEEPNAAGRRALWDQYRPMYGVKDPAPKSIEDQGWTGSEIRNACEIAHDQTLSLRDAMKLIIPITQSDPENLHSLRTQATGKFLCASRPGPYMMPMDEQADAPARRMS